MKKVIAFSLLLLCIPITAIAIYKGVKLETKYDQVKVGKIIEKKLFSYKISLNRLQILIIVYKDHDTLDIYVKNINDFFL